MRNSFEDMKRFIAEQDDLIMDTADQQHETTQKIIGGPRPQPGTPRLPKGTSTEENMLEDIPTKRKNVFRRALKGLSMRSNNDLAKIEEMLVQLLGDVEGLKADKDYLPTRRGPEGQRSINSIDNARVGSQDGYEPEGQAGTGSTGNQSGYFSSHSLRQVGERPVHDNRRASVNRVSTVLEGDEELDADEQNVLNNQFEHNEALLTPTQENIRGASVPLATPPQSHLPLGTQSNENTPKTNTDKSKKHKSSGSSFFPKFSRWSKTTASSAPGTPKGNGKKDRPFSGASRSGSDLNYDDAYYDPQGEDKLRTQQSIEDEMYADDVRPPSPLIPSQVSDNPKYQSHRNSINLQHPQPRQGPTPRYQNQLESEAQNFDSPLSPSSDQWGSNPTLQRFSIGNNRYSGGTGHLSPISDAGYSETSSAAGRGSGPARPPKIRDEGPLVPRRPPKVALDNGQPVYETLAVPDEHRYSSGSISIENVSH